MFADSDNDEDNNPTHTAEDPADLSLFIENTLKEHPEWIKTATVSTVEQGTLRLIHVASSSTVVGYTATQDKFYFPLDSPIVEAAQWVHYPPK